jgi:hypothetical protein
MGYVKSQAELQAARGYGSSGKSVCPDHVDDNVLKQLIADYASDASCSYCSVSGTEDAPVAAAFDDFMDLFMVGVRHRYGRADDEAVPRDEGEYVGATTYDSDEVAEDVFHEALDDYPDRTQDDLLVDILSVMNPDTWVAHNWQWLSDGERLAYGWDSFKELVKHRTRFLFIRWPKRQPYDPDEMSPLELFESLVALLNDLPGTTRDIDIDTPLFRGRMYLEKPALNDLNAKELGSTPVDKAGANRMSPAGISMFYGATDIDTAVAEVGAHSSYSWAAVGEFRTVHRLRVLDLTHLPALPSIFDPDVRSASRYEQVAFLRGFVNDLTLPVVLDGREHVEYVPTQVFTEYLRYTFPDPIDGLRFPSTQGPGHNVVLFFDPSFCADDSNVGPDARLVLSADRITTHRVATVIRPPGP